jgi:hypothetical protein
MFVDNTVTKKFKGEEKYDKFAIARIKGCTIDCKDYSNYKFYKKLLKTVLNSDIITLIKVNEEVPNIKGVLLVMQARPIRKQHINVCYFLMGLFYLLKFIN